MHWLVECNPLPGNEMFAQGPAIATNHCAYICACGVEGIGSNGPSFNRASGGGVAHV